MGAWFRKVVLPLRRRSPEPKGELFTPFIAAGDFRKGDKLCFYGDHIYKWDPAGALPAVFIARRNIRAGQRVINDPTDSRRSDLIVIL